MQSKESIMERDVNYSHARADWYALLDAETVDWIDKDSNVFIHQSLSTPCLDVIESCEGIYITDVSGKQYMDFHGNSVHQIGYETLANFRQLIGTDAARVADIRDGFAAGEARLKGVVPTLKVDYNLDIITPEIIGPDVRQGPAFLTGGSDKKRSEILLDFLRQNTQLIGIGETGLTGLKVFSDYSNPEDGLSFVELDQEINGIPVFRGEVKAGFTKNGELIRVINNLAPGLDGVELSTDFGDPVSAVKAAGEKIEAEMSTLDLRAERSGKVG